MTAAKKRETSETATVETATVQNAKPLFNKEQMIASARYSNCRDLVGALLDDKEKYTYEMVDSLIEEYKKGQVK